MNADLGAVCNRVLEALFNGVYQGLLVFGLLWLGIRLLPRSNAATRHAVGFAGMLVLAALPAMHLAQVLWPQVREVMAMRLPRVTAAETHNSPAALQSKSDQPINSPVPSEESPAETVVIRDVVDSTTAEKLEVSAAEAVPEQTFLERPTDGFSFAIPFEAAAGLLSIWILISTWRLLGLAHQCLLLNAIKRRCWPASEELRERFEAVRAEMGVQRKAGFGLTESIRTPIAAGFLKPMVLLPARLWETEKPARLDGILRHELAHVRRWDDWTNLAQQIIHALFFFHPGVCWLSSRLTLEREIACDDHALASISSRRDYALLLAEFASRMQCREWAAAPGAWSKKGQLKERINMIMNGKRNASTRLARASAGLLTAGAALAALLVMQAGPRLALADEPAQPPQPPQPPAEAAPAATATTTAEISADASSEADVNVTVDGIVTANGQTLAVISGPRKKPGVAMVNPLPHPHPHPVPHPVPAVAHVADVHVAHPPHPPNARHHAQVAQPRQHGSGGPGNRDLERRLERLERMVERLAGGHKEEGKFEWKGEFKNGHFDLKNPEFDAKFHEKMGKLHSELQHKFSKEEMDRIHEHAKRAGEHARKEAERAKKEVERAAREGEKHARADVRRDDRPMQERRKALENQRKALERQMHALERQIQEMEREQERGERERERAEQERERAREKAEREREKAEQENERERQKPESEGKDKPEDNAPDGETPKKRAVR